VQAGDLVKVDTGSPYIGRVGVITNVYHQFGVVYYEVFFGGAPRSIPFRKNILRIINEK